LSEKGRKKRKDKKSKKQVIAHGKTEWNIGPNLLRRLRLLLEGRKSGGRVKRGRKSFRAEEAAVLGFER